MQNPNNKLLSILVALAVVFGVPLWLAIRYWEEDKKAIAAIKAEKIRIETEEFIKQTAAKAETERVANNNSMKEALKVSILSIKRDLRNSGWIVELELTNLRKESILGFRGEVGFNTILDGPVCRWWVEYDNEIIGLKSIRTITNLYPSDNEYRNCPYPEDKEADRITAEFNLCSIVFEGGIRKYYEAGWNSQTLDCRVRLYPEREIQYSPIKLKARGNTEENFLDK